jgi:hypothetical protein
LADYDPEIRTRTAARIAGPLLIASAVAALVRYNTLFLLLPAFVSDAPLVLAVGVFTTIAGLTLLSLHHHWTSVPAAILTILAFIVTLRGASMMILPALATRYAGFIADLPVIALIGAAILVLVGAWLSFIGWFSRGAAS